MRMVLKDDQLNSCSMFGTFNLRNESDLASFKQAFDALCEHLWGKEHLQSWRLWERAYHEGYDADFPNTSLVIEMCFRDRQAALESWSYIESGVSPIGSLHFAVTSQVKDTHFVLCRQVS